MSSVVLMHALMHAWMRVHSAAAAGTGQALKGQGI